MSKPKRKAAKQKNDRSFDPLISLRACHADRRSQITFEALYSYTISNIKEARQAARGIARYSRQNPNVMCDWETVSRIAVIAGWGFASRDYLGPPKPTRKRAREIGDAASRIRSAQILLDKVSRTDLNERNAAIVRQHLSDALNVLNGTKKHPLLEYLFAKYYGKTGKRMPRSRPAHRLRDSSPDSRIPIMLCQHFRHVSGGESPAHRLVAEIANAAIPSGAFNTARVRDMEIRHSLRPDDVYSLRSLLSGR
jgi:choline dehydrogenase-like flavoprotein